jgi:hypothetical protein
MSKNAIQIVERIEQQIAQVILYLGAIDALAEMSRACVTPQQDAFLFQTVYESLWDGVIVRIGTIWDKSKNVGSLPKLSLELKRLRTAAALVVSKEIDKAESDERRRLREWRHMVVAHSSLALNPENFDMKNGISVNDVRSEAEHVERLLLSASSAIGRSPVYYGILKEDALENARRSLGKWQRNVA